MALEVKSRLAGICAVLAGVAPSFETQTGFSAVTRTGLGVYELTLDREYDPQKAQAKATPRKAIGYVTCELTAPTTITVVCRDSVGALVDQDFGLVFWNIAGAT